MDCQQVNELSIAHILGELKPESWESLALEFHLQTCPACAERYENDKRTIGFIESHKSELAGAFENLEVNEVDKKQIERNWQAIESKLERTDVKERKAGYRSIAGRLTAAAACLAIGAIVCLFVLDSRLRMGRNPELQASAPALSIRIEVLTGDGGIIVPAGGLIESGDALKTLVINRKHRLVMNTDTALSVRPLKDDERTGCIVNLVSGRIYASIEHDGNPFVVKTVQGRAVITGTIFDIEADTDVTKLIVAEGKVEFASQAGSVEVKAGRQSMVFADSAPTVPQLCDAKELTAWAKPPELQQLLAKVESVKKDFRLEELELNFVAAPVDLENINYDRWVMQNREWFEREFPKIFSLKNALEKENIKTDYPELLIASGELRRFVFPPYSRERLGFTDYNSLLEAANRYGFDDKWLSENISNIKPGLKDSVTAKQTSFEEWIDGFEHLVQSKKEADGGLLLGSLHASVFLENTRTLNWLCIAEGIANISEMDKAVTLELLETQITAAVSLKGGIFKLLKTSINQPCDVDDYVKLLEAVLENINTIKESEEEISGQLTLK